MRRLLLSPWTWVLVALVARLVLLFALPSTGGAMKIDPERLKGRAAAEVSTLEYLDRRTDYHPLTEDEHSYDKMAKNLLAGRGFVMETRWLITTPGAPAMYAGCTYPLFVAGVYLVGGSGRQLPLYLLQVLLHALAAFALYRAARRVAGEVAGATAAAYFALHPSLLWCAVSMMSEALCVPLFALAAWWLVEPEALGGHRSLRRAAALGLLFAVLCLARSTFSYFVALIALGLAFRAWRSRGAGPLRVGPVIAFVLVFGAVSAPWTVRNYVHWDRFIPFSTKSGAAAWMHNHPGLEVEFGSKAIFGRQPIDIFDDEIQLLPDEAARDARLMALYKEFIAEDPLKFIGLCWMRFWMALLPVSVTSQTLVAKLGAWYAKGVVLAALLLGAALLRRRLWWRLAPLLVLVVAWQGLQTLAGPGLRYRLPVDPIWSILVGVLVAASLSAVAPRLVGPLGRRWLRRRYRRDEGPMPSSKPTAAAPPSESP